MIFLLEWWNQIPTLRGSDDVRNRSPGCPQIPVFKSYKQTDYNHPLNSSRGMPGRTDHVTSFSRANTLGPGSSVGVKKGITNITRLKKPASEASHGQFASFFTLTSFTRKEPADPKLMHSQRNILAKSWVAPLQTCQKTLQPTSGKSRYR